jgi:hypothetical protein
VEEMRKFCGRCGRVDRGRGGYKKRAREFAPFFILPAKIYYGTEGVTVRRPAVTAYVHVSVVRPAVAFVEVIV